MLIETMPKLNPKKLLYFIFLFLCLLFMIMSLAFCKIFYAWKTCTHTQSLMSSSRAPSNCYPNPLNGSKWTHIFAWHNKLASSLYANIVYMSERRFHVTTGKIISLRLLFNFSFFILFLNELMLFNACDYKWGKEWEKKKVLDCSKIII